MQRLSTVFRARAWGRFARTWQLHATSQSVGTLRPAFVRCSCAWSQRPYAAALPVRRSHPPVVRVYSSEPDTLVDDELLAREVQQVLPTYCCGCGVKLQQESTDAPGYFQVPQKLIEMVERKLQLADEELASTGIKQQQHSVVDLREEEAEEPPVTVKVPEAKDEPLPDVLCARCFSLKNYGKVKNAAAEGQLPSFDLGKKVGRKITLQKDRRAVVLCVVDVWDFDGSLPRAALQALVPPGSENMPPEDLNFQLMVAVNKFDLLPSEATPTRVERWVRMRMRDAGLPPVSKVFMVSAINGFGLRTMISTIKDRLGFRGDLWVVGAQNSGKSSLINAMKKAGGTAGKGDPTVAPVPGTTLGLIKVPGVPLGPNHRTFDTPGVPHNYQLTAILQPDEVKMLLPRSRIRPRSYRIAADQTLLIGAVARIDVIKVPQTTVYMTVFVSNEINLHLGKTETAQERWQKHGGTLLQPPLVPERLQELGKMFVRDVEVDGTTWTKNSVDIAIAGLGWVSLCFEGHAELKVWTYPQVQVTSHEALIPDRQRELQRPGLSKAIPSDHKNAKSKKMGQGGARGALSR